MLVREVKLRVLISFTGHDNPRTGCFRNSYVTSSEKFTLFLISGPLNSSRGVQLASPTRLSFFPRNAGIKSRSLYSHVPEGGMVSMVVRPPVKDRKSTRLNSSHGYISYAVFCLKNKNDLQSPPPDPDRPQRTADKQRGHYDSNLFYAALNHSPHPTKR